MIDPVRPPFAETAIESLVHAFYASVRDDELLGPVFAARITDWDAHLDRMVLFWRSVLRGEPGYRPDRGSPRTLHGRLDRVGHEHYDRWLHLFEETAFEVFPPEAARNVVARAHRIAAHLSSHLGPRPQGAFSPPPTLSTRPPRAPR
jgi:hemoglobin